MARHFEPQPSGPDDKIEEVLMGVAIVLMVFLVYVLTETLPYVIL